MQVNQQLGPVPATKFHILLIFSLLQKNSVESETKET